jgi:hypothetical protein
MSTDIAGLINNGATAVVIGILILGFYRAVQLRGAFTNQTYRSRATWSALLMLTIIASNLANYFPATTSGALSVIEALPFIALIIVIFGFVDRSVIVAIQTDFFHRNTLRWLQFRLPTGTVLIATATIAFPAFVYLPSFNGTLPPPNYPVWGLIAFYLIFIAFPLILAYFTAALILGARRTSDRGLKRNIMFIGLALSTLVISIVATTPFNEGTLPYVIINQGTSLVGIYLLYRSVMSLSPLGHVEKESATTSAHVPQVGAPA